MQKCKKKTARILLRLLATEILQSGEKMITSRMALNLMDQVSKLEIESGVRDM